mgnify:FL=1
MKLAAASIEPDLVLASGVDVFSIKPNSRATLVLSSSAPPDCLRQSERKILTIPGSAALDHWLAESLGEHARIADGPAVTTFAVRLALFWRCNPILLVGDVPVASTAMPISARVRAYLVEKWIVAIVTKSAGLVQVVDSGLGEIPNLPSADYSTTLTLLTDNLARPIRRAALYRRVKDLASRLAEVQAEARRLLPSGEAALLTHPENVAAVDATLFAAVENATALPVLQLVELELARRRIDSSDAGSARIAAALHYLELADRLAVPLLEALHASGEELR